MPNLLHKTKEHMIKLMPLAAVLVLFGFGLNLGLNNTSAAPGINQELNYQGKLVSSTGTAVTNSNYNFRFRLYDASSGGTLLWTERWTSTSTQVSTVSGIFSVQLGSLDSLTGIDFNSDTLYLQVDFDADANGSWEESFATRKRLSSTPYAFNTDKVDGLNATSTAAIANYLLALDSNGNLDLFGQGVSSTYATTTNLYVSGTSIFDGTISGTGFANAWDSLFITTTTWSGDLTVDGNTVLNGDVGFENVLYLAGQPTNQIKFEYSAIELKPGLGNLNFLEADGSGSQSEVVINQDQADIDFRVEGSGISNLLFADASTDRLGVATSTPLFRFQVGSIVDDTYFSVDTSGNATTTGRLVVGTTVPGDLVGAGDLFVSRNATTTGTLGIGEYATSTLGYFTQGNLHIGGTSVFDGLISGAGFTNAWDSLFIATTTWSGFDNLFASSYNSTTTLNGFSPSDYLLTSAFDSNWDTRFIATTTWSGDLLVDGNATITGTLAIDQITNTVGSTATTTFQTNVSIAQGKDLQVSNIYSYSPLTINADVVGTGDANFGFFQTGGGVSSGRLDRGLEFVKGSLIDTDNPDGAASSTVDSLLLRTSFKPAFTSQATTPGDPNLGLQLLHVDPLNNKIKSQVFSVGDGNNSSRLTFGTTGGGTFAEQMSIRGNGNIGFGVFFPNYKFEIGDNSNTVFSVSAGGSATTTGTLNVEGYASTTNLVLGPNGSNLSNFTDLYVSSGNLFFDGTQLTGSGGLGINDWQFGGTSDYITPTSSVGLLVNASSTIIGDFRVDGDANFSGNVGVGTTTPQRLLSVWDDATAYLQVAGINGSTGSSGIIELQGLRTSADGDIAQIDITNWEGTGDGGVVSRILFEKGASLNTGSIALQVRPSGGSATTALFVEETGNVGIGTTSPSGQLHIYDSSGNVNSIIESVSGSYAFSRYKSGTNYWDLAAKDTEYSNAYQFRYNGNTPQMVIQTDGNVGIGTTTPGAKLDVNVTTSLTPGLHISNSGTTPTYNGFRINSDNSSTGSTRNWFVGANVTEYGDFQIIQSNALGGNPVTAGTARFVIEDGGNVGIGTASPDATLSVTGTASTTVALNTTGTLHVGGAATIDGATQANNFLIDSTTAINDAAITIDDTSRYIWTPSSGWGEYWNTTDNTIEWYGTGGTERMDFDLDTGNIQFDGTLTVSGASGTINGGTIWHSGNDGSGSTLDADLLDGLNQTSASTISTVVSRDSSGDINARLFRSEYDSTNGTIGYIMTQIDTVSNNYIRPSTPAQLVTGLGLEAGGSRDIWVEKAGDTMTGELSINNSAADGAGVTFLSSGFTNYQIDNLSGSLRFFQPGDTRMTLSSIGDLSFDGDLTVSGGDINGPTGAYIDISEENTGGFTFNDNTGTYPDIYCKGSGGTNVLCEFLSGIFVNSGTAYFTNEILPRGGIADDGGNLVLNDIVDVSSYLTTVGGVHVGGTSDPGTDNLVVDGSSTFTGNIVKIRNVATSFPASQGAADTYLKNDGAGNLTWAAGAGGGTVNSGVGGFLSYYPSAGTTVDDATGLYWDDAGKVLGVATSTNLGFIQSTYINSGAELSPTLNATITYISSGAGAGESPNLGTGGTGADTYISSGGDSGSFIGENPGAAAGNVFLARGGDPSDPGEAWGADGQVFVGNHDGSDTADFTVYGNSSTTGKVGIGTAVSASYSLDVLSNIASGYAANFFNDGNLATRYGIRVQAGLDDGTGLTYYLNAYDGDGTNVGYLANNAGTFAVTDVSDIRTKTNVVNTTIGGLEIINALRVVDFNRISNPDGEIIHGFIAQEVQEVFPEMVTTGEDGMLGIIKTSLIPVLTKAIQEQQIQIDDLRVTSLASSTQPLAVSESELDVTTLVVRESATFYGTITVVGEAGFEHRVTFYDDIKVAGKIYVSADTAGTVTIPANATSTEVIFDGEYEFVPKVVATANQNMGNTSVWISRKTTTGFVINIDSPLEVATTFDWIALALSDNLANANATPIIDSFTTSRDIVGFDVPVELWAHVSDSDTPTEELNYQWTVSPNLGTIQGNSSLVTWRINEGEITQDTEVVITFTVSDGYTESSQSVTIQIQIGNQAPEEPEENPILGCMDNTATNYNSNATQNDDSCEYEETLVLGCMDNTATNYNSNATQDDDSCEYEIVTEETPPPDTGIEVTTN